MNIGEKIKQARIAQGMTQSELGSAVGVSGVAIMRYEKGLREPKFDILQLISDKLCVPISELLEMHPYPDPNGPNSRYSESVRAPIVFSYFMKDLGFEIRYDQNSFIEDDQGNEVPTHIIIRDRRENCEYRVTAEEWDILEKDVISYAKYKYIELISKIKDKKEA